MPARRFSALALAALMLAGPAVAKHRPPSVDYRPPEPVPLAHPTPGAIFAPSYVALTSGARAGAIGDIITIVLVERTQATKTNAAKTGRNGGFGLTPPATGPLALFKPSDLNLSGTQSFNGQGEASQANALNGEVSVTVIGVKGNGTLVVRGEKAVTLNRGDEYIRVTGLVRLADITADNRVLSTRVADAKIEYTGKGEIARASRQGWLQRFFSAVSPF